MTRKTLTYEATVARRPGSSFIRGITVISSDGSREFLRLDSIPAARKALREGNVQPWVKVALEEFDRLA